jgi:sterol desaturase/sphingolipid hydroxylase (fatty acid hydroxylase superfamily)
MALVCLTSGFVGWTLAEYWIHRGLFHALTAFERMHTVHHLNPKGWVGIASWGTFGTFAAIWLAAAALIDVAIASTFTAGVILGYLTYCIVHVRYHHGDRTKFNRYIAFMWRHHAAHHRGGKGNFGVTSPLWDFVFGSYRQGREVIPHRSPPSVSLTAAINPNRRG